MGGMGGLGARRRFLASAMLLLGLFLTVRGYRCLDGDQAFRFPMMVHAAHPELFAADPFVRAFDTFNPHRGALALIGGLSQLVPLPLVLGGLFVATFLAAAWGVTRLAMAFWPGGGESVGWTAFALILVGLAGNIGTNHLYESILLDRQIAFALGWWAYALALRAPEQGVWRPALLLGLATLVHPTLGLQLTLLLAGGVLAWWLFGVDGRSDVRSRVVLLGLLALAVAPGLALNLRGSSTLYDGVDLSTFRRLVLEVQSPQHMMPHLWRRPQWLAWFCYLILAGIGLWSVRRTEKPARGAADRLVLLLLVNLLGLAVAWVGIVVVGNLRLALFQPFRLATTCRGLCLIVFAPHLLRLWQKETVAARVRGALIFVGLAGDWMLVVVTLTELAFVFVEQRALTTSPWKMMREAPWALLMLGLFFLARHDTEFGHRILAGVLLASVVGFRWLERHPLEWTPRRQWRVAGLIWVVPLAALVVELMPHGWVDTNRGVAAALVRKCRWTEVPIDDQERLALWCRENTAENARFIGPPGLKTFRLWSQRSLMFNRAGSPYYGRSLVDWGERFRAHVGFEGSLDAFVEAYLNRRYELERGYDRLDENALAALAEQQGADLVVARANSPRLGPLERVHTEGSWSVYRRMDVPAVALRR